MLRAPGASRRLGRVMRRPVCLRGLRADAPLDVDVDAGAVLAQAARHTARWLRLAPELFEAVTGLGWQTADLLEPDSEEWAKCLSLVRLGGRLESKLGRRGAAVAWLNGRHLEQSPTPLEVLVAANGLVVLNAYLDAFER